MVKNIKLLIGCIVVTALSWAVLHFLGQYAFLLMLVITVALLVSKVGKPKFGQKK